MEVLFKWLMIVVQVEIVGGGVVVIFSDGAVGVAQRLDNGVPSVDSQF